MARKLIWKHWYYPQGIWYGHMDLLEKSRIIGSYIKDKGEGNTTEKGNTYTYHINNISRSLFLISKGRVFTLASRGELKSRKMQLIFLPWNFSEIIDDLGRTISDTKLSEKYFYTPELKLFTELSMLYWVRM